MTPTQLHYKQVLDGEGNLQSLEIWQGTQHITIALASSNYRDGSANFKWDTIKKTVDRLQEVAMKDAAEAIKRR